MITLLITISSLLGYSEGKERWPVHHLEYSEENPGDYCIGHYFVNDTQKRKKDDHRITQGCSGDNSG